MITHDLGVVANICDRVAVMYGGRIVEKAPVVELFTQPKRPYTRGLLNSIPRWDRESSELLKAISGQPPHLAELPSGCAFHPRCPLKMDRCEEESPKPKKLGETERACFAELSQLTKAQ